MLNKHLKNGRCAAIFISYLLASRAVLPADLFYEVNSAINRGILSDSYWQSRGLEGASSKVLAFTNTRLGATAQVADFEILVERQKVATLSSDSNALFAASVSEQALNSLKPGSYPLYGKLNSFEFDAAGIVFRQRSALDNLSWALTPKILRLNTFKTGYGLGQLDVGSNSQKLTGNVERQGLSPYGFLTNQIEPQMGIGASVDIQMNYIFQSSKFDFEVLNLASKLPVTGMFRSERNYQVNTLNGNLVFSSVPSLTGTYGQEDKSLRLPRILKTSWTDQWFDSRWSQKLGVIAIEDGKIIWGEADYRLGDSNFSFRTYELQNLFITYAKQNFGVDKLSLEFTVGSAFHAKSQWLMTGLRYTF